MRKVMPSYGMCHAMTCHEPVSRRVFGASPWPPSERSEPETKCSWTVPWPHVKKVIDGHRLGCWAAGLLGCWAAGLLGCWAGPRLEVVMIAHYLIFDWFFHFRLSHLSAIAYAEICWEMPIFFEKTVPEWSQNGAERPRLCGSCVGSKVWSPSARWSQPRRGPTDSVSSMRCAVGASVQTPWPFLL